MTENKLQVRPLKRLENEMYWTADMSIQLVKSETRPRHWSAIPTDTRDMELSNMTGRLGSFSSLKALANALMSPDKPPTYSVRPLHKEYRRTMVHPISRPGVPSSSSLKTYRDRLRQYRTHDGMFLIHRTKGGWDIGLDANKLPPMSLPLIEVFEQRFQTWRTSHSLIAPIRSLKEAASLLESALLAEPVYLLWQLEAAAKA